MSIFNDTQLAFRTKSDADLQKAYWLFTSIQKPFLSQIGTRILNFSIKNNVPLVQPVVKNTLFQHFVGGVSREDAVPVVEELYRHNIGSIFDYAVEGKESEISFDNTCEEIKFNIAFARGRKEIPFVVFKPTGFGRLRIFEEVSAGNELTGSEQKEWDDVKRRYREVCALAAEYDVRLMIDAEETWMQDAADDLAREMMRQYNQEKTLIWNTVQMYRTGRMEFFRNELDLAKKGNYKLGFKIVRGAYMEKERARAEEYGYPSPIQPNKAATDKNYNASIDFVLQNLDYVSGYFGTHNEKSTELVLDKMKALHIPNDSPRIFFGQLYGMSDNITFYLGAKGYHATKYLPYGSVKDVIPYLTRRAQENTSVAGQTGRELSLIEAEMKRRGIKPL